MLIEQRHGFELGLRHRPCFHRRKYLLEPGQARLRRGEVRIGEPILLADHLADVLPNGRLRYEVQIGIRIRLPTLALDDGSRLASARRIGGTRYGGTELAVRILRIFLHDMRAIEALLVAQLDAAEIQDAVLHRRQHPLAAAGGFALV
jgi:hypothetical protein